MTVETIFCDRQFKEPILEILNDAIINTTALYDYKPRSLEMMSSWFDAKEKGKFPVIGIVEGKRLIGFGSYGTFRNWPAYQYSVEHSIYIRKEYRGQGFGHKILNEILKEAEKQNYHNVIGGIDSENEASKKLHLKAGFEFSGRIKHAGFKFGKWLDLDFYQYLLKTPRKPVDA